MDTRLYIGSTTPSNNSADNTDYNTMSINTNNNIQLNKYKLFCSEFLGMTTFILMSLSNVAIFGLLSGNMSWEGVAISWGFNLLFGIKMASYGKAYLNPCVALADYVLNGSVSVCELGIYVSAELLGAFTGAAITYGIHRNLYLEVSKDNNTNLCGYFATYNAEGINKLQAFLVELIGTALFSLAIFKVVNCKDSEKWAHYAIAMSLTAVTLALGAQTAFSYNWARDFGPRLFITTVEADCFAKNGHYWAVSMAGTFLGAFVGCLASKIN
jgi:glycerol uptake facilitator-like aquaporin